MKLSKHSILYTNIRSLSKNIIQLRSLARELDPDFIMLTEIFNPLKKYVKINNYHDNITKVRNTSTFGGGLAIYIKSCYPYAMDDKINNLNLIKLEALAVKTFLDNSHVTLVVVYRAPGPKISDTFLDIENILSNIDSSRVIIAGDINLDILRDDSVNDRYHDKIISHNLNQIVKCETRITHNRASLLDHILTNIPSARAIVSNYQLSDHQVLFCLFDKELKNLIATQKSQFIKRF